MIKEEIEKLIETSVKELQKEGKLPGFKIPEILVERPKENNHGDHSTNIALQMAKTVKKNPKEIAEILIEEIKTKNPKLFKKIETTGGFFNFFFSEKYLQGKIK